MSDNSYFTAILAISLIIYIILYFKETFEVEHLDNKQADKQSNKQSNTINSQYNTAMTNLKATNVDNIIDSVTSKLVNTPTKDNTNLASSNTSNIDSLFNNDLRGSNSPSNIGGFDSTGKVNLAPPDQTGILTPELSKIVDKNQQLASKDLLPKDKKDWFADIPASISLDDANLNSYYIVLPMVGQSRKNSSYDIRSSLAVPKFGVSPWNNSSLDVPVLNGSLC